MIKATVATEDATFWTNDGINLSGLARAAVAVWNSSGAPNGHYAIRVTARDRSGATAVAMAAVTVQD